MTKVDDGIEADLLDIVDEVMFAGTPTEATLGQTWDDLKPSDVQMSLIAFKAQEAFGHVAGSLDGKKLFDGDVTLEQACAEIRMRLKRRTKVRP